MDNIIIMHFADNRELVLDKYSSLDISRRGREFHANATNTNPNLSFNDLFTQIQEYLGNDTTFSVTVVRGEGRVTFDRISVDYYLTGQSEVLRFGQQLYNENVG